MPQLDISTFAPQLVWLAISFIVLYVLMAWLGLPRIGKAIGARRDRIDGDLARAAQVKADAEEVLAAYQKGLAEARGEAQATLKATTDRLAAEAAERQRELAQRLAQQIAAAEARIAAMKNEALAEIRGIALDVGRAVVEKLTGAVPDDARMAAAVERTLAAAAGERAH
ncbi:MAG TPA: F0F1 ATP synthase subunit B' [Stellaceae bacterium]|jgi:F-type H+-transporting ATPase subunit b|nr:F0F1 ATP synthase subunit B' [Stellaceae bacterium]